MTAAIDTSSEALAIFALAPQSPIVREERELLSAPGNVMLLLERPTEPEGSTLSRDKSREQFPATLLETSALRTEGYWDVGDVPESLIQQVLWQQVFHSPDTTEDDPSVVGRSLEGISAAESTQFDRALDPPLSAWQEQAWNRIGELIEVASTWPTSAGSAPQLALLSAAELLVAALDALPPSRKPVFAVDSDGLPNFVTYIDDVYVHISIEKPDRISWYSVIEGEERFYDDQYFDGFTLPSELAAALSYTSVQAVPEGVWAA